MESLFKIGLIAAESALGQLVGCLQTSDADTVAETALLDKVRWLLCRPEEPDALSLLAQADAVIIAGIIRSERETAAVAGTLRTLQRMGRKILAVTLWGPLAHELAAQVPWPGILLPDSNSTDLPPGEALRACVYDELRQAGSDASARTNISTSSATTSARAAASSLSAKTMEAAPRNIRGRQVRDLSHLRQRGNAAVRSVMPVSAAAAKTEELPLSAGAASGAGQAGFALVLQPESHDAHEVESLPVPDWQRTVTNHAFETEAAAESSFSDDHDLSPEAESAVGKEPLNPGQMVQDSLLSTETFQPEAIICAPASEIEEPQLVAQPGPAEAERHLVEEQHRQLQAEVESLKARLLGFAKQQPAPSGEDEAQERLAQLEAELQVAQQQVKSLSEQLIAAAEGTQFAESKTEDFFQRFVRERRRAADLSSQLSEAGERIAHLNSAFEGHQSVATRMKVHFSKLERVRDMLTSERDRALKERDEARSQVYRLDAELKAVNGEHLSAVSQLKEQLRQFEVLRDELVIERDNALAEIDAVQTQAAELKPGSQHLSEIEAVNDRLQRQLRALESLNEEIGSDRDRLLTELDHERSLYGQLEAENQSLTQANDNLLNSLQSATLRLEEPEVARSGVSGIEQQAESTDSQPQPEVARPIFTTEEFSDLEQMAGEDLVVIRRIESVVQRWLAAQEDCADGWQISQVNGAHPSGVVSYE